VEEEGPGGVRRALSTTGWASALSAATTILSFASLTIADHQGVRSLGHLIVIGLSLVTLVGFAMVPLGWLTLWRWRPPTDESPSS
jgi:predicted RND superfamily exporter protein